MKYFMIATCLLFTGIAGCCPCGRACPQSRRNASAAKVDKGAVSPKCGSACLPECNAPCSRDNR